MPQTVRVNVTTLANAKAVRREVRNGRNVLVVPSATLPDEIVMNGVLYPASEIEASYAGLDKTPAPLGHPMVNGKFVSARDPEGINLGWIGAFNTNVRREGGRVLLDKVIDVEVANRSEGGKAVLAAIEAGGPIHTSTGLLCRLEVVNGAVHKHVARGIVWDHDAILLNEEGAATPEKGVGMLVNAKGETEEIEVINSTLTDAADQEIDWAGQRLISAIQSRQSLTVWDRIKATIMDAISAPEQATIANQKDTDMADEKKIDDLSAKMDGMAEAIAKAIGTTIGETITNALKPITDAQAAMVANQKAKDDAEADELRTKIVKANLMDEASAKELTLNAARALAKKAEPGKAVGLNTSFAGNTQTSGFKLPKAEG